MILKDYKRIIPVRYQGADYEKDVSEPVKKALVDQMQKKEGLFLYGDTGVGKTHIVCALAKKIIEEGFDVRFYNTSRFLESLRNEYSTGYDKSEDYQGLFEETMEFKGVLIFDDLGSEKPSEWAIERLYLIINEKYESMIPMIFTSNCDKGMLSERLGDRIVSRIGGMTLKVKIPGVDRRLTEKQNAL